MTNRSNRRLKTLPNPMCLEHARSIRSRRADNSSWPGPLRPTRRPDIREQSTPLSSNMRAGKTGGVHIRVSPQGVTRHPRVGHDTSRIHSPRTRTNSSMTPAASAKARCWVKAPSEPPSSAAAGGVFRCSCLSPRSGRVLRRPPDASSAGESAAQRMTGEAGVASLPTFLATQESRPPAGAGPGRRNAE